MLGQAGKNIENSGFTDIRLAGKGHEKLPSGWIMDYFACRFRYPENQDLFRLIDRRLNSV
jgi:hypothetical protein